MVRQRGAVRCTPQHCHAAWSVSAKVSVGCAPSACHSEPAGEESRPGLAPARPISPAFSLLSPSCVISSSHAGAAPSRHEELRSHTYAVVGEFFTAACLCLRPRQGAGVERKQADGQGLCGFEAGPRFFACGLRMTSGRDLRGRATRGASFLWPEQVNPHVLAHPCGIAGVLS